MMRNFFILSTVMFWLAVAAFWAADAWLPSEAPRPDSAAANKAWTLVEVAKHDTTADCWMAIDGAVYNLTAYLPEHPSNPAVILPWCGKEATEAYHTKTKGRPHSSRADQMLSTYFIGTLIRP
ncbi:MAG: cytochrome b5 domain-containing protein [Burkholderiales bacterium]|nr:cytochrome b5 domain-containing protein [Burkholderiales bacterium]